MPSVLISYIKNPQSLQFLVHWKREVVGWTRYLHWIDTGKSAPTPNIYKTNTLKSYGRRYQLRTFVETGTLYGETTKAVCSYFERVVTIELDLNLYRQATKRFRSNSKIDCVYGDSAWMLPEVLHSINQPALFWLDGHYSAGITARGVKDTPICS